MLLEEIKNIKSDTKECRKFGITIGIVLALIGFVLLYYDKSLYVWFHTIGFALIAFGLAVPLLLKPFHFVWMVLAVVLGFIMSRIILTLLFYLVVTPIGLFTRMIGKDFLDLKLEKNKKSYWNIREKKDYDPVSTEKQF